MISAQKEQKVCSKQAPYHIYCFRIILYLEFYPIQPQVGDLTDEKRGRENCAFTSLQLMWCFTVSTAALGCWVSV